MQVWHIIPNNDIHDHIESKVCSCSPRVQKVEGTDAILVIHNAFDGRHIIEDVKSVLEDN